MKIIYSLIISLVISVPQLAFGHESKFCTKEYYEKISPLYQNRNSETAIILFQILSCGGQISKESKRGQFVALVGGYMRENPELIENLFTSASTADNTDAAKIYLDSLWFCSTKECQNKLMERPFQLPVNDVNNLLSESPPDPFSIPIDSPATLDFLWGYFFGTGDTRIVERVYNLLHTNWGALNSSESMGASKRMLLSAARWSLVSIASQKELARSVLEKEETITAKELLKKIETR